MMTGDSPAGVRRIDAGAQSFPLSRCLLLDLDGTLADTAPDMTGALNALRAGMDWSRSIRSWSAPASLTARAC